MSVTSRPILRDIANAIQKAGDVNDWDLHGQLQYLWMAAADGELRDDEARDALRDLAGSLLMRSSGPGSDPLHRARAAREPYATWTSTGVLPVVVDDPSLVVTFDAHARDEIDPARRHTDTERGGWLYGRPAWYAPPLPIVIGIALDATREASASHVFFDLAARGAFEDQIKELGAHLVRCGEWHTHPRGGAFPSNADLRGMLAGFELREAEGARAHLALIGTERHIIPFLIRRVDGVVRVERGAPQR